MPRIARIVIPDRPHHVTQRGNNRQDVFFVDDDRATYLALLKEEAHRHGVAIEGYCLMTNHIHAIVVPSSEEALARAFGRTHFRYAQYLNHLHKRSGHLWQNRFYSCALDDEHYWTAMVYVEQNPVRARDVAADVSRRTHGWSSAAAHCGDGPDAAGFLDLASWRNRLDGCSWRERLSEKLDRETLAAMRLNTHRGRPLGSDGFLSKLEALLGRRLRPLPVGRPRKEANNR